MSEVQLHPNEIERPKRLGSKQEVGGEKSNIRSRYTDVKQPKVNSCETLASKTKPQILPFMLLLLSPQAARVSMLTPKIVPIALAMTSVIEEYLVWEKYCNDSMTIVNRIRLR